MPGWNLVSFNVHPADTTVASVLASLSGSYDLVYAWDASGAHSSGGNWMKYAPSAPAYANSLTNLNETMGFWIHMTAADTLDVSGIVPVTTSVSLSTNAGGWNLVAYPASVNRALPAALSGNGVVPISRWCTPITPLIPPTRGSCLPRPRPYGPMT